MSEYREPTKEEVEALVAFAKAHGRKWKEELSTVYWYNARLWSGGDKPEYGSILHGIRNTFGPSWLYDVFRLPKEK